MAKAGGIFMPITVVKGTVNKKIVTREIPKVFIYISVLKLLLCMTIYKSPEGVLS